MEILKDMEKGYYYLVDSSGYPIYDDDGNNIHFETYEEAKEYVLALES